MKKNLIKIALIVFLTLPTLVSANNTGTNVLRLNIPKNPNLNDLENLIINISQIAISLVGTVALLFLIIGGFQYITSAGNPDSIMKAKNTILYSIIGLILAIMAYSIITFIIQKII